MNKREKENSLREICARYTEKEYTALDSLKELDRRVKSPALKAAYAAGTAAALVMGTGMSLVMTDIGGTLGIQKPLSVGIVIGIIGLVAAVINYPVYKRILADRRKKYAGEIVKLCDDIIQDR